MVKNTFVAPRCPGCPIRILFQKITLSNVPAENSGLTLWKNFIIIVVRWCHNVHLLLLESVLCALTDPQEAIKQILEPDSWPNLRTSNVLVECSQWASRIGSITNNAYASWIATIRERSAKKWHKILPGWTPWHKKMHRGNEPNEWQQSHEKLDTKPDYDY